VAFDWSSIFQPFSAAEFHESSDVGEIKDLGVADVHHCALVETSGRAPNQ